MTIDELLAVVRMKRPPAPAEELEAFEASLGCTLPDEYRRFLVACNGGFVGGKYWFYGEDAVGNERTAGLHHIGGFREEYYFSLPGARSVYGDRIPDSLLWIHDDPFGNAVCIGLTGEHRGRLYLWDHENEPRGDWDGAVETAGNVSLLAVSFMEYAAGVRPLR